ncbi:hypothetical protein COO20_13740 [Thalassospira marina]|uniref:Uncharacterized protein n=1 Tax=Thalassospira marina TaxID=2048283 RepID=A0A2N3KST1_9PROT|nr:hypothetical protein COO20_13740 [Thalassospira marina]
MNKITGLGAKPETGIVLSPRLVDPFAVTGFNISLGIIWGKSQTAWHGVPGVVWQGVFNAENGYWGAVAGNGHVAGGL